MQDLRCDQERRDKVQGTSDPQLASMQNAWWTDGDRQKEAGKSTEVEAWQVQADITVKRDAIPSRARSGTLC